KAEARARVERILPEFRVASAAWLSLFAYPLSGGFKKWGFVPKAVVHPLLRLEDRLLGLPGPCLAVRRFITLDRRAKKYTLTGPRPAMAYLEFVLKVFDFFCRRSMKRCFSRMNELERSTAGLITSR